MKRLFAFVPAIFLMLLLISSFIKKEKRAAERAPGKTESSTSTTPRVGSLTGPLSKVPGDDVDRIKSDPAGAVLKSIDGGQTWEDIGEGLLEIEQPVNFFAGESDIYLYSKEVIYHSKSNLKAPVWVNGNVPYPKAASIVFNHSSVMAFNQQGHIYQKKADANTWLPIYTGFKKRGMRSIFKTSDGTVFLGSDNGLYKSADEGKTWKQVQNEGWVMNVIESQGVLMATGQRGIMRSTDNGEHWQWVISEGGVGIAVETIQDGFAAISYNTEKKSRRVRISMDRGKTWKAIDEKLRPSSSITSIKQVGRYLIIGHPDGIYRSSDMGKTWTSVHPGIDNVTNSKFKFVTTWNSEPEKVFRIYVSADVLYAVGGGAGC